MSTYFTSDLHFSHKGICKARGMTIEENNDLIINNWNKTVKKQCRCSYNDSNTNS